MAYIMSGPAFFAEYNEQPRTCNFPAGVATEITAKDLGQLAGSTGELAGPKHSALRPC